MSDETKFGGNSRVGKGKPIWILAAENNRKRKVIVRRVNGVIVQPKGK